MTVIAQAAGLSDAGRRRRHNEDAYVCEPPLFAIADGMGGAQAGELASRLAAASVGRSATAGLAGRDRVVALVEDANRSVYERATEDEAASGMGTTMTIALVEKDVVWLAHVGDSRAYLVRDGKLEQVTEDHSLVAELVRSGRLTAEEAGTHPHRSVITRAVGTEPDVEIDTIAVRPLPEDVFLLCSDGLTDMVGDAMILARVEESRLDLPRAAKALVDAANAAGGEDNVTVLLFRLANEGDTAELAEPSLAEPGRETDEDTLHGVPVPSGDGRVASSSERPARRPRLAILLATVAIAVVGLGALGVFSLSRSHFVGAEPDGHLAVYQGVPWDLGFGIKLYRRVYVSPLVTANFTLPERRKLLAHALVSRSKALAELHAYEQDVVP